MKQLKFHRWYCYKDGVKVGKRCPTDQIPDQLPEHTPWIRGTGPFTEEARNNITMAMRAVFGGVPKSPEQKEKMRQAKLGVPKSQAHREAMSRSQQLRWYPNGKDWM